jgi:GR25 family glycosyltransferase involved in LPS biosynthesis
MLFVDYISKGGLNDNQFSSIQLRLAVFCHDIVMRTIHKAYIIVLLWIIVMCLYRGRVVEGFDASETSTMDPPVYVINLDKDAERYQEFMDFYDKSDFSKIPCKRFPAIYGKNVDSESYLAPHAKDEFKTVNTHGYRTKHHQLTPGGMGCFLSHSRLAKQFLEEHENDDVPYMVVFEDDTVCKPETKQLLDEYISNAPSDWDLLSFQQWRLKGEDVNELYKKPSSFWGTGMYVLRKSGAQKLLDEVKDTKIDGQIDAYLSRMSQQNKMNLYACKKTLTVDNSKNISNIQAELHEKNGVDPFDYFGTPL